MKLNELEKVIRGTQSVILEWRNDRSKKIESMTIRLDELKYLSNDLLNSEVLRIEAFDDTIMIFIKRAN